MKSRTLAEDYIDRAGKRLLAIEKLFELEDWPDTVRESQESVELALKALLRHCRIEPPRLHDTSELLADNAALLPPLPPETLDRMVEISRRLRRDRELAFYGSEDLVPSQFYKKKDAREALDGARFVVAAVRQAMKGGR